MHAAQHQRLHVIHAHVFGIPAAQTLMPYRIEQGFPFERVYIPRTTTFRAAVLVQGNEPPLVVGLPRFVLFPEPVCVRGTIVTHVLLICRIACPFRVTLAVPYTSCLFRGRTTRVLLGVLGTTLSAHVL